MKQVAVAIHANKKFDLDPLNHLHGLDFIHIDVADGKFTKVRNLDLEVFGLISSKFDIPIIAHMMVMNPIQYFDEIMEHVKFFTFHYEINLNLKKIINAIKSRKKLVGIALNPDTPINKIIPFLEFLDMVLVMSVFPGESGQKFIDATIQKVEELYSFKKEFNFIIDVDGGVNLENAKLLKADIVSSTSTILNSKNPNKVIELFKKNY